MKEVIIDTDILSYYMKRVDEVVKDYENIENLEIANWTLANE